MQHGPPHGASLREGAQGDELAYALLRRVDSRVGCVHRIKELEVRSDQAVSPTEIAVVFGSWIELLRTELDDKVFRPLMPKLQALAGAGRPGIVGSAAELEAGERARQAVEGAED